MNVENSQTVSGDGDLFEDKEMADSGNEALTELLHKYVSNLMVGEHPLEQIMSGPELLPVIASEQSNLPTPHPMVTAEKRPIMSESEPPLAAEQLNLNLPTITPPSHAIVTTEQQLNESKVIFNTLSRFLLIPLAGCCHQFCMRQVLLWGG